MRLVVLNDVAGQLVEPDWLRRAEPVHRQLRSQLPGDYRERLTQVFANGGRMVLVVEDDAVVGLALWRLVENTYEGRRLYVDDLVTDEQRRSQGAGKMLLDWLQTQARTLACDVLALDSGVQRAQAHRFYFREGMHVSSFCFRKALK